MQSKIPDHIFADAIIVAGGRGTRAMDGMNEARPKQYWPLAGKPVLAHTLEGFIKSPHVRSIQVVIHADDQALYKEALSFCESAKLRPPVMGGATRQLSVAAGLAALMPPQAAVVLVHDAARPLVNEALIERAFKCLLDNPSWAGAVPVIAGADALTRINDGGELDHKPVDRNGVFRVQTPQIFHSAALIEAMYRACEAGETNHPDESALLHSAGLRVGSFAGDALNFKLTTAEDFTLMRALHSQSTTTRVGYGTDFHRTTAGDHVWLCGIKITADFGIEAHSDGDVALHALTDAMLGTIGEGDIGVHFPPSDEKWRGAASDQFVIFALEKLQQRGGMLEHIDITLVLERPQIAPHREAMLARLGEITGLPPTAIGLKATTAEGLGDIGKGLGISATVLATVRLPA